MSLLVNDSRIGLEHHFLKILNQFFAFLVTSSETSPSAFVKSPFTFRTLSSTGGLLSEPSFHIAKTSLVQRTPTVE